jgi:hypothetical protein
MWKGDLIRSWEKGHICYKMAKNLDELPWTIEKAETMNDELQYFEGEMYKKVSRRLGGFSQSLIVSFKTTEII